MCKHAAAVLYGVGARLDKSPELLFRLRGVDEAELIAADMALPGGTATADTLADDDLGSIFGIDLEDGEGAPAPSPRKPKAPAGFRPTGAMIARLRAQCGFSVAEFAALLRVSGATVRRWEAAPGPLDLQTRPREALLALRREIEKLDD